jgi:uncharacterized membrane protein YjgN (DUF898 family)
VLSAAWTRVKPFDYSAEGSTVMKSRRILYLFVGVYYGLESFAGPILASFARVGSSQWLPFHAIFDTTLRV